MSATSKSRAASAPIAQILAVYGILAAGAAGLVLLGFMPAAAIDPHALTRPMFAQFALTVLVWIALPIARNWAVFTGRASPRYFQDFRTNPPAEWIERPARAYNNLMQAPTLFYVIALLMMVTPWADSVQLTLAWVFVALRALHAAIYIGLNHLLARMASFGLSSFALWEIWLRYALHAL